VTFAIDLWPSELYILLQLDQTPLMRGMSTYHAASEVQKLASNTEYKITRDRQKERLTYVRETCSGKFSQMANQINLLIITEND